MKLDIDDVGHVGNDFGEPLKEIRVEFVALQGGELDENRGARQPQINGHVRT